MENSVDLEDYVTEWAWQMFDVLKSKEEAKIPKEHLVLDIKWSKVRFQHGKNYYITKYQNIWKGWYRFSHVNHIFL